MKNATATPGPWVVNVRDMLHDADVIRTADGTFVAQTRTYQTPKMASFHNPADANLIAAAPDLYAALKAVVTDFAGGSFRNLTGENAQAALAAIAKADGRSGTDCGMGQHGWNNETCCWCGLRRRNHWTIERDVNHGAHVPVDRIALDVKHEYEPPAKRVNAV